MKILAPLRSLNEVRSLCNAGADQFYCGIVNKNGPVNDRFNDTINNFGTAEEFSEAVSLANNLGRDVYLCINHHSPNINDALNQARIAESSGARGVIITDLLLMKKVREANFDLEIGASCLTNTMNIQSVRFLKRFGVSIAHMSRHIGLGELKTIKDGVKDIQLGVFGLRGTCMNFETYCRLHQLNQRGKPHLCFYYTTKEIIGAPLFSKEILNQRINAAPVSCGFCAYKKLNEIGVYAVKIEGRKVPTKEKIENTAIVRKVFDLIESGIDEGQFYKKCKELASGYFGKECREEFCHF